MEYVRIFQILLGIILISFPSLITTSHDRLNIPSESVLSQIAEINRPKHVLDSIGIFGFKYIQRMGELESSSNYQAINRLGYLGKYQFHKKTLRRIGFTKEEIKSFINEPLLQEKAMIYLTLYNKRYFERTHLLKYINKKVGGVRITLEGMLAAAHLRGPAAVKKYLRSGGRINLKDANKTSVRDYLKEFENF